MIKDLNEYFDTIFTIKNKIFKKKTKNIVVVWEVKLEIMLTKNERAKSAKFFKTSCTPWGLTPENLFPITIESTVTYQDVRGGTCTYNIFKNNQK